MPGLGNLHERLAFNLSFFEFVAALNFQPYFGHGSALANSFLYLLGLATLVLMVPWPRLQEIFRGCPLDQLAALLPIPYLLYLGTNFSGLNSPSPDLAGEILQILLLVGLAQETSRVARGQPPNPVRGAILATLGVAAITLKLSNLIFASLTILLLMTLVGWDVRRSARLLCPAVMLLTLWVGRGYLLSDMPFYPLSAGRVPFEWAMPAIHADESRCIIRAWARLPGPHFREATTGWKWLRPWLGRITASHHLEVVYPLVLSVVVLPVALWLSRRLSVRSKPALWLVPTGAIAFWFVFGPEPRFGRALFWCLCYASSLSLLQQLQTRLSPNHYRLAVIALLLLCSRPLLWLYRLDAVSVTGWHAPPEVAMRPERTAMGLIVWVPKKGDQAWDAALPSTPYFRREVRLRVPGRLESGFAWGR